MGPDFSLDIHLFIDSFIQSFIHSTYICCIPMIYQAVGPGVLRKAKERKSHLNLQPSRGDRH